jgi:predicted RNA-binding protein with PUA-like domain
MNGKQALSACRTDKWLFKSEPDTHAWDAQKARGAKGEPWTGVRNYLARNNMRAMKVGDLGFFYHSNEGKEIVGVVRVSALAHPDQDDDTGTWDCVDVVAVCDMPNPVTLAAVKDNPALAQMALVTSMRLSVQPVTAEQWREVCRMGGLDPKKIK